MGEVELARRVAMEREARDWSYEGLAERMTNVGCPIQGSAIYKIEKADPPRRITVDELIAFATVFETPVRDLLLPREVVIDAKLGRLFERWEEARQEAFAARERRDEAFAKLAKFVQEFHSDALEPFYRRVSEWATGQAETEVEADAIRAMVLAGAVPVESFQKLEDEAIEALAAERRANRPD
ncbi:helix-turn-helix domain-containing protein [Nocardioides sp. URHA0032]|uniref:helix-turn-helix domain-containing protein n=1 Tax=Nocardioides sp. URHA0032 TaxID=1380388 RepID=UPI000B19429D|nr:helix-turn-helix transcriptional regulator [Nocardioides sp. URHA0032]